MTALADNALTERYCPSRSNLIRAILRERSAGLLCKNYFDSILSVASDPSRWGTVFSLFKLALPRDMACA